jgi:hypothetical protein
MADLAGMPIASPFSCCGAAKMCGRRCFLRVSEIFESHETPNIVAGGRRASVEIGHSLSSVCAEEGDGRNHLEQQSSECAG